MANSELTTVTWSPVSSNDSDGNSTSESNLATINWPFLGLFFIPVLAVWGNVLVCLSVRVEKRLKSRFNYFLVSLAMSDMLCAILVMPVSAWKMVGGENFPRVPKTVCLAWYSLDVFFTASTIIHLCTISIDRYFALRNPLRYHRSRKKSSLVLKIAIAWIIPFSIAGPLFLLAVHLENKHADPSFKGCGPNNVYFLVTATVVTFFLPLILMTVTYVLTVMTVVEQTNKAKAALYPKSIGQLVLRPNASALGLRRQLKLEQLRKSSQQERSDQESEAARTNSEDEEARLIEQRNRVEQPKDVDEEELDAWAETPLSPLPTPLPSPKNSANNSPSHTADPDPVDTSRTGRRVVIAIVRRGRELKGSIFSKSKWRRQQQHSGGEVPDIKFSTADQEERPSSHQFIPLTTQSHTVEAAAQILQQQQQQQESEEDENNIANGTRQFSFSSTQESPLTSTRKENLRSEYIAASSPGRASTSSTSRLLMVPNGSASNSSFRLKKTAVRQHSSPKLNVTVNATGGPGQRRAAAKRRMDYIHKGQKAVQVLGILFGLFVICYLPFFVFLLMDFFCQSCQQITQKLLIPLEWVAYSASMLNPIVYHVFNPTFRRTFHQLMRGNCRAENRPIGSQTRFTNT